LGKGSPAGRPCECRSASFDARSGVAYSAAAALYGDGRSVEDMGRPIRLADCLMRDSGGNPVGLDSIKKAVEQEGKFVKQSGGRGQFGEVHILCNNAGVLHFKSLVTATEEGWAG